MTAKVFVLIQSHLVGSSKNSGCCRVSKQGYVLARKKREFTRGEGLLQRIRGSREGI